MNLFKDTPETFLLQPITSVLIVLAFITATDNSCYGSCICVLSLSYLLGFAFAFYAK